MNQTWCNILVAKETMKLYDEFILLLSEIAPLKIGAKIVDPTEPTALAAAE